MFPKKNIKYNDASINIEKITFLLDIIHGELKFKNNIYKESNTFI